MTETTYSTAAGNVPAEIVYQGIIIHQRDERLSLTDMWKAANAPSGRAPADWVESKPVQEFIETVAASLNAGNSGIIESRRGKGGGTWAHWQIGLAYAKYLSPEFHMWCNTVVRERMEGKVTPAHVSVASLDAEVRSALGGIIKSVVRSIARDEIPALVATAIAADPRVAVGEYLSVRELMDEKKIPSGGRNGLNRRLGCALRDRVIANRDFRVRKCPRTQTWLYQADLARMFMASETAKALITVHMDHLVKKAGQGVLQFPKGRRPKPSGGGKGGAH